MIVLAFCSCKKELSKEGSNANTSTQVDVYVAGYEVNGSVSVAKYWKNGNPVTLGEGYANSITVSINDVYVCGAGVGGATYWKNGSPVILGVGGANSIAVSGNDVYLAGGIGPMQCIGKTATPHFSPRIHVL